MKTEFIIDDLIDINGVKIIKPSVSKDIRGKIWTSFADDLGSKILPNELTFKHDKFCHSRKNVLRGIHGDNKTWKLVSSVYGHIFQVIVDLRKSSSTYLNSKSFILNDNDELSLLIPPGVGNGYCIKSDYSVYHYKLAYEGEYNDANDQFSYKWNDKYLGINWPIKNPILSNRDSFN